MTPGLPVARIRARQRVSAPTRAFSSVERTSSPAPFSSSLSGGKPGRRRDSSTSNSTVSPRSIRSGRTTMWACAGSAGKVASTADIVAPTYAARKDHRFTGLGLVYLARIKSAYYPRRCTLVHNGRTSPMRKHSPWLWLALLLASLALVAAGCGGDDDEAADTGATTAEGGAEAAEQVITVNWGTEPPSLDPGLASDVTSANILLNIMDPLVKLDDDLNPVAAAAESFETSEDGKTVTFTLRDDLKWTNGDPVTAQDFEYSWKRTVSPELGADYAYQFYGIVGAQEYNACEKACDAMADKVGVNAVDERTLEVTLTSAQPWFLQQLAHHSFLAVNQKAVEQFGDKW